MKKVYLTACAVSALLMSAPVSASQYCSGTISHSWVDNAGNVFIYGSWRSDHTMICNVKAEWKSITPDVCATWIAKADAATTLTRTVIIYYATTQPCSALPTYGNSPAPGYVMLN